MLRFILLKYFFDKIQNEIKTFAMLSRFCSLGGMGIIVMLEVERHLGVNSVSIQKARAHQLEDQEGLVMILPRGLKDAEKFAIELIDVSVMLAEKVGHSM